MYHPRLFGNKRLKRNDCNNGQSTNPHPYHYYSRLGSNNFARPIVSLRNTTGVFPTSSSSSIGTSTSSRLKWVRNPEACPSTATTSSSLRPAAVVTASPKKSLVSSSKGGTVKSRPNQKAAQSNYGQYKWVASSKVLSSPKKLKAPSPQYVIRKYSLKRVDKQSVGMKPSTSTVSGVGNSSARLATPRKAKTESLRLSFRASKSPKKFHQATKVVQRSKQVLLKTKQKTNTFCAFFNKHGVCKTKELLGKCPYVHDARQVLICTEHIKIGKCSKTQCNLSHNLDIGRFPLCKFFAAGNCTVENCQFRHVSSVIGKGNQWKWKSQHKTKVSSLGNGQKQNDVIKITNATKSSTVGHPSSTLPVSAEVSSDSDLIPSSRYFDVLPSSQPIVVLVPRRLPKDLQVPQPCPDSIKTKSTLSANSNHKPEAYDSKRTNGCDAEPMNHDDAATSGLISSGSNNTQVSTIKSVFAGIDLRSQKNPAMHHNKGKQTTAIALKKTKMPSFIKF